MSATVGDQLDPLKTTVGAVDTKNLLSGFKDTPMPPEWFIDNLKAIKNELEPWLDQLVPWINENFDKPVGNRGKAPWLTTDRYSIIYTRVFKHTTTPRTPLVYTICGDLNVQIMEYFREVCIRYSPRAGPGRSFMIVMLVNVFKYMDRFYIKRIADTPLKEQAEELMQKAWAFRRVKQLGAFRHWANAQDNVEERFAYPNGPSFKRLMGGSSAQSMNKRPREGAEAEE